MTDETVSGGGNLPSDSRIERNVFGFEQEIGFSELQELGVTHALKGLPYYNRSTPEESLISLARIGCRRAFDELMERYLEKAQQWAKNKVRDKDVAADIVSETFLSAWKGIRNFRGNIWFGCWLHHILNNKCCDYYRYCQTRQTSRHVSLEENADSLPDPKSDCLKHLIQCEEVQKGLEAISKLCEPNKSVAEMYMILDIPVNEISAELGLPCAKVRYLIAQSRKQLRIKKSESEESV